MTTTAHIPASPDLNQMLSIAQGVVDALPPAFRTAAREVALRVVDWPTDDMLHELDMDIDDRLGLTGLYEGIPVTHKSVFHQPLGPDVVWLFREPILAEWRDRENVTIEELITNVTVHEFAHHFGWSDADIASIDRWWE